MHFKILAVAVVLVFTRPAWCLESAPLEITDEVLTVAQCGNKFAADLYAHLRSDQPTSLFFSPYSISTALAMTYAGAEGETETQMAKTLHLTLHQAKLHQTLSKLRILLNSTEEGEFQLRVANRLWGQKDFRFLPRFLQIMKGDYGAELGLLDFKQSEAARTSINSWIEEQTNHKIHDLIASGVLNADTRLVLTNAVYFKARWTHEFSKDATIDAPFHITASEKVIVSMMHQAHRFRCGTSDDVQLLELPYGEGDSLSMLILLPKKIDALNDLEKRLTSENVQTWSSGLHSQLVHVYLPKFKLTSEFSLKDVLESMGLSLVFTDKADFSGMSTEEQLFISAVIHKAFVDVNEEGTEAAAATAVAMGAGAAFPSPNDPVEFRADHPFVFLIRDNRTQSILFLGRVTNPKE